MTVFYDGAEIQRLDSDDIRVELVRRKVLDALDAAALELYGTESIGWTDRELPELFRAIDRHAAAILERVCEGA
jgi:hypothetical protein